MACQDYWLGKAVAASSRTEYEFGLSEPRAYVRDVRNAEAHVLDAGHFALDTAADDIAVLVRAFLGSLKEILK
jgi:hypothetical protein